MSYSLSYMNASFDMDQNSNTGYEFFLVDCTSGNITVDMTNQGFDGQTFIYKRADSSSNTLTLAAKTGYTIDGGASIVVPPHNCCEVVYYGTNWYVSIY